MLVALSAETLSTPKTKIAIDNSLATQKCEQSAKVFRLQKSYAYISSILCIFISSARF